MTFLVYNPQWPFNIRNQFILSFIPSLESIHSPPFGTLNQFILPFIFSSHRFIPLLSHSIGTFIFFLHPFNSNTFLLLTSFIYKFVFSTYKHMFVELKKNTSLDLGKLHFFIDLFGFREFIINKLCMFSNRNSLELW